MHLPRIGMAVVAAVLAVLVGSLVGTSPAQANGPVETLTVATAGNGVGRYVTSTDGFINCGTTCSHSYEYGSTVTLEEQVYGEGSSFVGWSGACSGTEYECTVSMTATQSVTAKFLIDCTPPKLRGLSLRRARKALRVRDCRTGEIRHARSRTVKPGRVITQNPKPFTIGLKPYASVNLVISTGKH